MLIVCESMWGPRDYIAGCELRLPSSRIAKRSFKIEILNYQFLRKLRIKIFWWLNISSFRISLLALPTSWPSTQINQVPPQTPIWVQIKHNLILLSANKEEHNKILLLEYCWFILSSSLLSTLVFIITISEIRLFKTREKQCSSVAKLQVWKIFKGLW